MSTDDTYLGVFFGSPTSPRRKAWNAMSDEDSIGERAPSQVQEHRMDNVVFAVFTLPR